MVKEIAVWWRAYQIQTYCPMTSQYLKMKAIFDDWVTIFYVQNNISAFIEDAGIQFLDFLSTQTSDKTLCSLSAFESALLKVKKGSIKSFEIHWFCNPNTLIYQLLKDTKTKVENYQIPQFKTIVSAHYTFLYEVVKI
jgi:hypothetical protein